MKETSVMRWIPKGRDAGTFAVFLLLDIVSKSILSTLPEAVCNGSGPWGVPVGGGLMIAITVIILAAFVVTALRRSFPGAGMPMALILGGGFGNLSDRLIFGCVRDYPFMPWFPAFNLADVWLSIGAIWLITRLMARKRPSASV